MKLHLIALFLWMLAATAVADAPALNGGEFSIERYTIDSGVAVLAGGDFTLSATFGQPDAGEPVSGGSFVLRGGFWAGFDAPGENIFRDGFE